MIVIQAACTLLCRKGFHFIRSLCGDKDSDHSRYVRDQFAVFTEETNKSKLAIQQSLDKLELLKKSLMQEYFG